MDKANSDLEKRLERRKDLMGPWLTGQGCQTTDEVMRVLDPLFRVTLKGSFSLGSAEEISKKEIRQAVCLATGTEVGEIVFQSISEPLSDLGCWIHFSDYYEGKELFKILGNVTWGSLWEINMGTLGDPLRRSLGRNHKDERLWRNLVYGIGNNLNSNIFHYVALHLARKPEEGRRFEPLLILCPKCIPLAFKDDEPNTVVVLVA